MEFAGDRVALRGYSPHTMRRQVQAARQFFTVTGIGALSEVSYDVDARQSQQLRDETDLTAEQVQPSSSPNWWQFLTLPKGRVRQYWTRAAREVVREVEASDSPLVFITFHAKYQSDVYRWRFSPCNPVLLQTIGIRAFFTLIDDVYQMHKRRPGDIQSERQMCFKYEDPAERALALVRETKASLVELIRWRQEEIATTEMLAAVSGCSAQLVSIRHPLATMHKLLESPESAFYFSHPITGVRADPNFPDVVGLKEIEDISSELRGRFTLIEPTTIDEYRIEQLGQGTPAPRLIPRLSCRWPFPAGEDEMLGGSDGFPTFGKQELLCPRENVVALELEEFFADLLAGTAPEEPTHLVSESIGGLVDLLKEDITWRDHTLVDQCGRLVVFRPAYRGIPSTGVRREIEYYRKLALSGPQDKHFCVLLHPPDDDDALAQYIALKLVSSWAEDSGVGPHIRPRLDVGAENQLIRDLTVALGSDADEETTARACADALSPRIEPEVSGPSPMTSGRRVGARTRNKEVLQAAAARALSTIQDHRYFRSGGLMPGRAAATDDARPPQPCCFLSNTPFGAVV